MPGPLSYHATVDAAAHRPRRRVTVLAAITLVTCPLFFFQARMLVSDAGGIAGAALLALWLWRIAPRFGPVAPDAPPARRRLLDHLRASGRYYWALDLRERLLIAARDAALRRVLRAQPEFAAARPQERAARLAALAGVSVEEAQRLLDAGGAIRGAAFIQVIQTAQRVHAALERGNR